MLLSINSIAQDWTVHFPDVPGVYTQHTDKYQVVEAFDYTNSIYSQGRSVVFRSIDDNLTGSNGALQLALLDNSGNEIMSSTGAFFEYADPNLMLTPICAAYNRNIQQYIVCGYGQELSGLSYTSWYATFDRDLIFLDYGYIQSGTNLYTFVTDVCPVYNAANGIDFAFVGKVDQSGNATDALSTTNFTSNLFLAEMDMNPIPANMISYFEPDLGIFNNQSIFPSSLIEINTPGIASSDGYFICGTLVGNTNDPFFYLRTGNNMQANPANYTTMGRFENIPGFPTHLNAQAALYDPNSGEIYIGGNITRTANNTAQTWGYFFDKIVNVNITPPTVLNAVSSTWFGATNGLAVLYPTIAGHNFINCEAIFSDFSNTTRKRIIERSNEDNVSNNGNLPDIFNVDFSNVNFNSTSWVPLSTLPVFSYPRIIPNMPQTTGYGEYFYSNHIRPYQQAIQEIGPFLNNEFYQIGQTGKINSSGIDNTVVLRTDGTAGLINNCNMTSQPFVRNALQGLFATAFLNGNLSGSMAVSNATLNGIGTAGNSIVLNNCSTTPFKPAIDKAIDNKVLYQNENNVFWKLNDAMTLDRIVVYAPSGQIIMELKGNALSAQHFSLDEFPTGIYLIEALFENHQKEIIKIIN